MSGRASLPGLDAAAIDRLAGEWNDTGLWDDIAALSAQFWNTSHDADAAATAWHHLVLAVGNFKRQAGRIVLRLRVGAAAPPPTVVRGEHVAVPGSPLQRLGCEDEASWAEFARSVHGFGVPTTTTLLAALWPQAHFVVDWRVRAAANGLRLDAGLQPTTGNRSEPFRRPADHLRRLRASAQLGAQHS